MVVGGDEWWLVVQTSPLLQAEAMLRDYRTMLVGQKLGTIEQEAASHALQRVNSEIHRVSQIMQRTTLRRAMRNVLDTEQYEAVIAEQVRLESIELQQAWG